MRSKPLLRASSQGKARVAGIVEVGGRVVSGFAEHRMGTYAAALAYRGLFALFPFMLLLVVLVGIFGPPDAFGRLVAEVRAQSVEQVPQQLEPVLEQGREQIQPLEEITGLAQKQANGELLLVGIGIALWSISALASTLADALNTVYGLTETRSWWKAQALSLASGPIVAIVVIVAIVSLVTGSRVIEGVAEASGLRDLYVLLFAWLHYPVALVLLWVALSFVYRYSPAVTLPWRSVWFGAALSELAWAIASVGFSIYLAKFADFGVTYGSLGAAVGLLVYINLSASIVLAGAELNAAMYPSAAHGTLRVPGRDPDDEVPPTEGAKTEDA
jgi:membrane protein